MVLPVMLIVAAFAVEADIRKAVPALLFQVPTNTLEIELDTNKLFEGANLMTSALSGPFLFVAGLSLGVAILAAIIRAVQSVRL